MNQLNPFIDADGNRRRLVGPVLYSASMRVAELAVQSGCSTVWIDMEHSAVGLQQAELLCMAIEGAGGVPLIRIPSAERPHVLGAIEVGASIVLVPVIDDAEQARQIVCHGMFPPIGNRGTNKNSRANRYGMYESAREMMDVANKRTQLFAQIETREGVDNVKSILDVEGLAGIFVGPSDLSLSLGIPGEMENPLLIDTVMSCIQAAHDAGKMAGTLSPPGSTLFNAAADAGAELLIFGSDVGALSSAWRSITGSS